jgi:AraC-like DNA-binding protein
MTRIVRSYYPTCPPEFSFFPYRVLRAGHIVTAPDYLIDRSSVPGTELIFAARGHGWIRTEGREFHVSPGDIAWLTTRHDHAHWPDPDDPWEVYWLRFDSSLEEPLERALGAVENPVFRVPEPAEPAQMFIRLFDELEHLTLASAATISGILGLIIDALVRSRTDQLWANSSTNRFSDLLSRLHFKVLRSYNQRWNAQRMAQELAISTPHLYRVFSSALGMSPNRWLRSIRIQQARRRLVESNDSIGEIAGQVGYSDQFHFSKDFRALTGLPPREYRRREQNRPVRKQRVRDQ